MRRRVEEFGRVELTDKEAKALSFSKGVHVCLIVCIILHVVWAKEFMAAFLTYPCFLIGSVMEVAFAGGTAAEVMKGVAKSFVSMALGFAMNFTLINLAHNGII